MTALVSLLFIAMIPIGCIFPYTCFNLFGAILMLAFHIPFWFLKTLFSADKIVLLMHF